ncbi:hypothetical protein D3C79_1058090 [compost metagenome]
MANSASQAPWLNLVIRTMTRTRAVMPKPMLLMVRDLTIRRRAVLSLASLRCLPQCRTMPNWLSVNEIKTPTM